MRTGRSNNKGYSIVELIVVITILVVLSGGTILSLGVIKNARDKKLAQSVYSGIGRTRVSTMAKGDFIGDKDTCAVLERKADGYYLHLYVLGDAENSDKIGIKTQTVYYSKNGGTKTALAENQKLTVRFKHDSGTPNEDQCDFTELEVGKHSVILEPVTGKCELKIN